MNIKKTAIIFLVVFVLICAVFVVFYNCIYRGSLNIYKKLPQKDTVNITAITDNNFVFPLEVSINSAIESKNKDTKYHYYIIGVELSDENIEKFKTLSRNNVEIDVLNQNNIYNLPKYRNFKIKERVGKTDLFKFNIAEIFPKFDKILYMDCDTIVRGDLSELYNTDLKDYYAGVVLDYNVANDEYVKNNGIHFYFNNGIMLLNLKKITKDNIVSKMLYRKQKDKTSKRTTQDTYNIIMYKNVLLLPPKYNFLRNIIDLKEEYVNDDFYNRYKLKQEEYKTPYEYFIKETVIIHYSGRKKPWVEDLSKKRGYSYWYDNMKKLKEYRANR